MANEVDNGLIRRLDAIRVKRGITLVAWAELSGVSRMTIHRALQNQQAISLHVVTRLADVLNLQLGIMKKDPLN